MAIGIVAKVKAIKGGGDDQLVTLDLFPNDALGPPSQGLSARREYRLADLEPYHP